jgi:Thioredoxin-like domain
VLEELRRRTARSGLDIIMINIWENVDPVAEARHFASIWGLDGTVLVDETGEYAARLGIRGVPTNVVVDGRGLVRTVGATTPQELNEVVSSLLTDGG